MSTSTALATGRPSKEEIAEMWRKERERLNRRLTAEEVEAWRVAIANATEFREKLLAERGGMPFRPGWMDLAEARDERTRQLGG